MNTRGGRAEYESEVRNKKQCEQRLRLYEGPGPNDSSNVKGKTAKQPPRFKPALDNFYGRMRKGHMQNAEKKNCGVGQ